MMLVVHGLWSQSGHLILWGENFDPSAPPPTSRRRQGKPRPHPFAAHGQVLAEALGDQAKSATHGQAGVSLPTRGGLPVASPEVGWVQTSAKSRATTAFASWIVDTCEYNQDDAYDLLSTQSLADVVIGSDMRYLRLVAEFAGDLVARGRVLPCLDSCAQGPIAVWRPLLTGGDAAWAKDLARSLPPACRAQVPLDQAQVSLDQSQAPHGSLARMIDDLVDAAARVALGNHTLANTRSTRGSPEAIRLWLRALTGRQRTFVADPDAVARMSADLADWHRDSMEGPIRACFRLAESADSDEAGSLGKDQQWRVEFALQSADEPSLIVDAARIWRSRGVLRALARRIETPQETFLSELGRATRLWPELNDALRSARPEGVTLDNAGALHFLRERASSLAAAGFGVMLPSWWGATRARLGVRLTARARGTSTSAPGTVAKDSGCGLHAIVDYDWQVALGDEVVSTEELLALAEVKTPLVRLRGQWVELDYQRLEAGLAHLSRGGQMTVGELLRAGLDGEHGPGDLPVTEIHAEGMLGDLLSGTVAQHSAEMEIPPGFQGTLRPYQHRGLAWLICLQSWQFGMILADDMGLGKTIQILALLAGDSENGPTLVVCPMSLVGNWQREAQKFAPHLRVHVHHGAERVRGAAFTEAVNGSDVVITTYALVTRDAQTLGKMTWHRIILDEAQAIKNAATQQSKAVRAIPARHRIAVTGTPVENRLADLWSIMEFANPGLLGPISQFTKRYAEPVERHGDNAAAERLRRITGPFILRRVKTDKTIISDLPEKMEMEVLCNLTSEQASLYQAVVNDMMAKIEESEGVERRGLILATMTKLKQVCNHPAHLLGDGSRLPGRSGKLARLEEILDEVLAAGEKALLFTQYAEFGGMVRGHLDATFGRETLFLHGGVSKSERDSMIERFHSEGSSGPPIFVLSLKAGGTGLTLTAANHVIHIDRWWNPAVEDQATDRAYRIGQSKAVQVRKCVCVGTLEEKISTMITQKRGLAARIVGTTEGWLTELSNAHLRELITLEAGAVVE